MKYNGLLWMKYIGLKAMPLEKMCKKVFRLNKVRSHPEPNVISHHDEYQRSNYLRQPQAISRSLPAFLAWF